MDAAAPPEIANTPAAVELVSLTKQYAQGAAAVAA